MNRKEIENYAFAMNTELRVLLESYLRINVILTKVTKEAYPFKIDTSFFETEDVEKTLPVLSKIFIGLSKMSNSNMCFAVIVACLVHDKDDRAKRMLENPENTLTAETMAFLAPLLNKENAREDFIDEIQALQEIMEYGEMHGKTGKLPTLEEISKAKFKHFHVTS